MTPERWQQVEQIYLAALEQTDGQRGAYLANACAGDEELRHEVESLLAHEAPAKSLLETPALQVAAETLAVSPEEELVGHSLGAYQILAQLGVGGMGVVYQARDTRLDRTVALKILPVEVAADKDRLQRFVREAKAASALNHPHVATIYEIGEVESMRFIAMEYVEGQTLAARINGHPLAIDEIVELGSQIADALDEAHSKGITHRDIKPANVMLTSRGRVKVLDFGLARMSRTALQPAASDISTMQKTAPGVVMGTVPYMSPEQALGREVDHRSDIFSLGVVLYEMATGRLPFAGASTSETLDRILHSQPDAMARFNYDVPAELERMVRKCLEKERERRYQAARDLLVDLKNLARDSTSTIRPAAQTTEGPSRLKRHKVGWAVASVSLVALILLAAFVPSWIRNRYQAAQPVLRPLKRLTFDAGLQSDPTWSPNNDFIAYSSDRGGNFDIWVQPLSGGDPIQVTHSPAYDSQPDWSPDGTQIVFRSEREGGGLYVVPAYGGRERKIAALGEHPRWSPDGTKILFRFRSKLYVVSLDGQPPREVQSEFLASLISLYAVFWHPDSQRVSLVGAKRPGESEERRAELGHWLAPVTGGPPLKSELPPAVEKQIQENKLWYVTSGSWAPSGRTIYFFSYYQGQRSVWKVAVDPQTLQWVAGPELLATSLGISQGSGDDFAVSRDGKRLAFTIGSENIRAWAFPFDAGTGKVKGPGQPVTSTGMIPMTLNLSRDGKKLAYVKSQQGAQKNELWEKSLDDGKERLLTTSEYLFFPTWTRDGARIAFRSYRPAIQEGKKVPSVLVLPAGGGDEQIIASGANDNPFDWTADGKEILVSTDLTRDGKWGELCLYPLSAAPHAETQRRVIVSNPEYDFYGARISPNDQWICFIGIKSGEPVTIYVVSTSGGEWTRITEGKFWDDKPCWSPDGKTIYFVSKRTGFYNVWGIRFDSVRGNPVGEPFRVTSFESPSQMIYTDVSSMSLGLAANRLVLPISEVTGSIWIMENVDK